MSASVSVMSVSDPDDTDKRGIMWDNKHYEYQENPLVGD